MYVVNADFKKDTKKLHNVPRVKQQLGRGAGMGTHAAWLPPLSSHMGQEKLWN